MTYEGVGPFSYQKAQSTNFLIIPIGNHHLSFAIVHVKLIFKICIFHAEITINIVFGFILFTQINFQEYYVDSAWGRDRL